MFRWSLMMEAVRTSETSVDNHFTRQYIPEDNSEYLGYLCTCRYNEAMSLNCGHPRVCCSLPTFYEHGQSSRLHGVVVTVLETGPKGRGLKPGWDDVFLKTIKIRSIPSFGSEVKPETSSRNILRHVKHPLRFSDRPTDRQNSHSFFDSCLPQISLLVGLVESSGGRVRSYPQPT
jgi:hypothetical protein